MTRMTLTWHTTLDERTCPICRPLDGHQWHFNAEKEPFPDYLYSPFTGRAVWDCIRDRSMAHGGTDRHCRCKVYAVFDLTSIDETLDALETAIIQTRILPRGAII